jgi:hypothetical protein
MRWRASADAAPWLDGRDDVFLRSWCPLQVTPDQYLNTIPFMDAIKETLDKNLAEDQLLPKL